MLFWASIFIGALVAIPSGVYLATVGLGKLTGDRVEPQPVWLHSQAFQFERDALYVAAMLFASEDDAQRACDLMPLLRNAIQGLTDTVRLREGGVQSFSEEEAGRELRDAVNQAIRPVEVHRVAMIDADRGVREIAETRRFLLCFDGRLYSSHRS